MAPGTLQGSGRPSKPYRQQQSNPALPHFVRSLREIHTLRHDRCKSQIHCQAHQQQQQQVPNSNSKDTILRPIEVSRGIAAARASESLRSDSLFKDPYAAAFSLQQQQQQQQQQRVGGDRNPQQQRQQLDRVLDVIGTRYIDECLLNAMAATNVNTIQSGDYRQVVLLGDGMDCRPFRLPWPPGTVIFLVAPAEVHEQAEAQLAAAAAAAAGEALIPPARVVRGCLLRRVNLNLAAAAAADHGGSSSDKISTIFTQELQRLGFRPDRLSVWAVQGLHNQGIREDTLRQLLTEVTNLAAFHSLLVGELPGRFSKREVENILAEAGVLGAVVRYDQEDISYCRWHEIEQLGLLDSQNSKITGAGVQTTGSVEETGPAAAAAAAADREVIQDRWLVTAQQLRLSLEQMGIYEEWSSEFSANDMGDDDIGNFS